MRYDIGTIVIIVAVLIFYLRLIIIQRQRIKKARYQYAQVSEKLGKKKGTAGSKPEIRYSKLGVQVRNWWLMGAGIVLLMAGAAVKYFDLRIGSFDYWWIPVLLGIISMALGVG